MANPQPSNRRSRARGVCGGLFVAFGCLTSSPAGDGGAETSTDLARANGPDFLAGGAGGAYFLASPGPLEVEVFKRDRNRTSRRTHLRAILVAPDREVLADVRLEDDGRPRGRGPGPLQRARLTTTVERPGIYGLSITISEDRYGEDIVWGLRTSCPRYVIVTARGHRDERHQEPIVLGDAGRPGDVCFRPRSGAFGVEVSGLRPEAEAPVLLDAGGEVAARLAREPSGRFTARIGAERPRGSGPWRLHLPVGAATVEIGGLTRWDARDATPDLCWWTPSPETFFPYGRFRWLLTPYGRTVWSEPGGAGRVAFRVSAPTTGPERVSLSLEHPESRGWQARLSTERVELDAGETREVEISWEARPDPAGAVPFACRLHATPATDPSCATYATLRLLPGRAPAASPLEMPIRLEPFRHENEQFGYLADYPVESQVYFDGAGRPWVARSRELATWRDGRWSTCALTASSTDGATWSASTTTSKVAFDARDRVYTLGRCRPGVGYALLSSTDEGRSFRASPIGDGRGATYDIEQFSGHNVPDGPPPVVRFHRTRSDPRRIWRRIHDLDLFLSEETDGGVECGAPIRLSDRCIGLSAHSGIPSSIVSRGDRVHVAWAEATDPDESVPGVPTFVTTCVRSERRAGTPALVGYGPPPNDIHNSPCITIDGDGYLHVLVGTHGRTFRYARSRQPNDAGGGWTPAVEIAPGARQTYVGMVCDPEGTLHLAFRLWERDPARFPAGIHASLSYMRKRPGQPWEAPRPLLVAPFSEYSIYYHRLTIDRRGALFLSHDYWSTYWGYRLDHRGKRRTLLTSPDRGQTWKLASTADLLPRGAGIAPR